MFVLALTPLFFCKTGVATTVALNGAYTSANTPNLTTPYTPLQQALQLMTPAISATIGGLSSQSSVQVVPAIYFVSIGYSSGLTIKVQAGVNNPLSTTLTLKWVTAPDIYWGTSSSGCATSSLGNLPNNTLTTSLGSLGSGCSNEVTVDFTGSLGDALDWYFGTSYYVTFPQANPAQFGVVIGSGYICTINYYKCAIALSENSCP